MSLLDHPTKWDHLWVGISDKKKQKVLKLVRTLRNNAASGQAVSDAAATGDFIIKDKEPVTKGGEGIASSSKTGSVGPEALFTLPNCPHKLGRPTCPGKPITAFLAAGNRFPLVMLTHDRPEQLQQTLVRRQKTSD